ncbi:MAG: XdhC/CoxI family protein [Firmicutes bacterium]|nr:XdhC/CoxI family protein [Bacillota bacterium]
MNKKILEAIRDIKEPLVLVTIIETKGSAPRHNGSKMIISKDGIIEGTVGGGIGEYNSLIEAQAVLSNKKFTIMDVARLGDDPNESLMICGGVNKLMLQYLDNRTKETYLKALEININGHGAKVRTDLLTGISILVDIGEAKKDNCFDDFIAPADNLLILGGGYVGYAIYELAVILGFEVTVFDDRAEFVDKSRFPDAKRLDSGDYLELINSYDFNDFTYVTVVTRGHLQDANCVKGIIRKNKRYLGLIGSKRKVRLILEDLFVSGYTKDEINKLHAPIGIDIGAETPEEIAVAIMAEIIGEKYGKKITKC